MTPEEERELHARYDRAIRTNRDAGGYSSALRTTLFVGSLVLMLAVAAGFAIVWGLS